MHRRLERARGVAPIAGEIGRDGPGLISSPKPMIASSTGHRFPRRAATVPEQQARTRKRRVGHTFALRLRTRKDGGLRCLIDLRTPLTNNDAERDLRMVELRQKISNGFRSKQGVRDFATLRAVITTAHKQG